MQLTALVTVLVQPEKQIPLLPVNQAGYLDSSVSKIHANRKEGDHT